ncbi:MAG: prepilin-type N-terminal cleavage/methylation domain-containing protein [Myxococcota bacterium]
MRPWEGETCRGEGGFTLLELLVVLVAGAMLLAGLSGALGQALRVWGLVQERQDLAQQARFALDRMVAAANGTTRLLLPLPENAATGYSESVRDVLAVALDPVIDRDRDGFADADNDRDGRLDEDFGRDRTNDGAPGLIGIDDDNDGSTDEVNWRDDDEDGSLDEDPANGLDDDGDGAVDEDPGWDMNGDASPGESGRDDDGDGFVDEGAVADDDEDGVLNEDWLDAVVFYLTGSTLMERVPNLDPVDGTDFSEAVLAENVSRFRVERLVPDPSDRALLIDITLELSAADGEMVSLSSRTRVGGGLGLPTATPPPPLPPLPPPPPGGGG